VQRIARYGRDKNGFRFVKVNINQETKVRWQVAVDLAPMIADKMVNAVFLERELKFLAQGFIDLAGGPSE